MNVLYIGLDNPLAISAAGFTAHKIKPTIAGGSIRRDKKEGTYLAVVNKTGEATVHVNVTMDDGSSKKVGSALFRVKRVPNPVATLGRTYESGKISAGKLKVQRGVVAELKDFVFDLRFHVVSYEMTYAAKGKDLITSRAKGAKFTTQMKSVLKRAKKGDFVFFQEIKVRGPDKLTRKLPSLVFEVM